jgi:hypothetical protein
MLHWVKYKYCKENEANGEVGLEVNTEKTKYMVVSYHQNVQQNHTLLITNKSSENVAEFNYLGTTVANQNCIHEEIQSRLHLGMLATILFRVFYLPVYSLKLKD